MKRERNVSCNENDNGSASVCDGLLARWRVCQACFFTALCIYLERMAKKKNPAAVALGRRGGKNSRVNLTPKKRTELARKAAAARWAKAKEE